MNSDHFTHLDESGQPAMVDVSGKAVTTREAIAESRIILGPEILAKLQDGDLQTKKGPVFQTAIIAGTMAAKRTHDLIPMCHPIPIEKIKVQIVPQEPDSAVITCTVKTTGKTGVEMEALTGASVAALTIYDMCKAMSLDLEIRETRLMKKSGGKRDLDRT
ncbi:cyclic pyranopterin monophosphate synthase MoaC [Pontibacter sp. G13]|uniref:cyclic pyranopterin monophosphate synthase MoaC n=1 Tax=Pontibacter sp. G13 TaxID=3074898 RepID=UPI002889A9D2|nr:cyclic pyranopterin monophosphate synthase MoaC [Pontibacter sp. G13]WNJ19850.1 cyclic pyranopterin monophosphate synthase MoaC [Pontibacter sp. G13]